MNKIVRDSMSITYFTRRNFLKTTALGAASLAVSGCAGSWGEAKQVISNRKTLHQMDFIGPKDGWCWPETLEPRFRQTADGLMLLGSQDNRCKLSGDGIHTFNGDSIELHFSLPAEPVGMLRFGYRGGFEKAYVKIGFKENLASFSTSQWNTDQPVAKTFFQLKNKETHVLLIEKNEGPGQLVKNADFKVYLDGQKIMELINQNVLPEMGVFIDVEGVDILIRRFIHRGTPSGIPEYLHIGGWQMPNRPDLAKNLDSICLGLSEAAQTGIQLLLTPETSLTGLFPGDEVTKHPQPIAEAENKLRSYMRNLKNAPYLIVGLPVWEKNKDGNTIRYNASRLYSPDGDIAGTYFKIHSCETDFWHGYQFNEFDIYGVPACMHICHDGRYPETWTIPVMFGARLIVHPSNSGKKVKVEPDASTKLSRFITTEPLKSNESTGNSHAFYINVNRKAGVIATSQSYNQSTVEYIKWVDQSGEQYQCLFHKKIRVHDAFGYWPMRSFRASEQVAKSYRDLYRAMGGQRS